MILGISGSPRTRGITSHAVKKILSQISGETEYITLAGKSIAGCISCLGCINDNKCVIKDDFPEIAEKLIAAKAIIIAAPNYYNMPNALTHCFLERCFCFRHQGNYLLKDKPVIILSTGYSQDQENSQTLNLIENFVISNKMKLEYKFLVGAYSQCYTCDYGKTCKQGKVFRDHGMVEELYPDMLPARFDEQEDSIIKCHKAADLLNKII